VISLRSSIISRAREGFEGIFFGKTREGVCKFGRDTSGFELRVLEGAGVAGGCLEGATVAGCCSPSLASCTGKVALPVIVVEFEAAGAGVCSSGGSEDGGSSPMLAFSGVRKGDLNGFLSVFVASFSRRRFAVGVDICAAVGALGSARLSVGRLV
jgi:hypothetical protein